MTGSDRWDRHRTVFYVCLGVFAAASAFAAFTSRAGDWEPISLLLVIAVFAVVSELLSTRWDEPGLASFVIASSAPLVLAATLLGPAPAIAIASLCIVVSGRRDRIPLPDFAANLANYASFMLVGGLLTRGLSDWFGVTPEDPGFAVVVLVVYVQTVLMSYLNNGISGHFIYGDPIRPRYIGQAATAVGAEGPIAFLTMATVYVYGSAGGVGALGILALLQLISQYFARAMLISRERAETLRKQTEELAALSESRSQLVGQVLHAEETERRRLAEALHDEALQNLLAAQRGLAEPRNGGLADAQVGVERTIDQLRGEIFHLHPAPLDRAGLDTALRTVAGQQAERGGFRFELDVDREAVGPRDALLFVLAREQLTNAAKHSGASEVRLAIARSNGSIVMDVLDDGCGIPDGRRDEALREGHIGLASSAERVEAVGGSLEVESVAGRGTRIRTTIPADPPS